MKKMNNLIISKYLQESQRITCSLGTKTKQDKKKQGRGILKTGGSKKVFVKQECKFL